MYASDSGAIRNKCPLCDSKLEFEKSDKITKWYCTKCRADGEVWKDNLLVICSCSAKGSMCDEVSNY